MSISQWGIWTPFRRAWLSKDYGQLIIWMAVGVGIPRWTGAMFAADGIRFTEQSEGILHALYILFITLYGLSGLGMAILEVLAIGYVFDALRVMKPRTAKSNKINTRWWGSLLFAAALLILMPVILGPHMLAQLTGVDIITFLETRVMQGAWILSVILVPMVIIGGVSFARAGLVAETAPRVISDTPERAPTLVLNEKRSRRRYDYDGKSEAEVLELKRFARRQRAKLRRERRKAQS